MAVNVQTLGPRLADRKLFLAAAIGFPLLVLIGYFRSYYFNAFFDVPGAPNLLVHAHGFVMTAWVLYFVTQAVLIRTKNVKLHMTLGLAGIALAALVVVVGLATAWDSHVIRRTSPPGVDPHGFLLIGVTDMLMFILFFGTAIYFRKRPAEHKTLMLMTAINFLPAAIARIPILPPELFILQAYAIPDVLALLCFGWHTWKHRKINKVFGAAILLLILSQPLRIAFAGSAAWLSMVAWLAA